MDEALHPSWARSHGHRVFPWPWGCPGKGPDTRGCPAVLGRWGIAELSPGEAAGAPEQTLRGLKGFERSYNLKILR